MNETKWTPGPWTARVWDEQDGFRQWVVDGGARGTDKVADVFYVNDTGAHDARLIAAAPELYKALKLLIEDVADYEAWKRPCYAVDVANAALVKARGE